MSRPIAWLPPWFFGRIAYLVFYCGTTLLRFLRLPSPHTRPAAPDHALTFAAAQLATGGGQWTWINAIALDGEGPPAVIMAHGHEVRVIDGPVLRFPGGPKALPPS